MKKEQSYERFDVREAQSNLALLWELDRHAYELVTKFSEEWINQCLASEAGPKVIMFPTQEGK